MFRLHKRVRRALEIVICSFSRAPLHFVRPLLPQRCQASPARRDLLSLQSVMETVTYTCVAPTGTPWFSPNPVIFPELPAGNVEDQYRIENLLGSGFSSSVYMAYDKATNKPYACKMLSKRSKNFYAKSIRTEVEIMLKLRGHLNVANLHTLFENEDYIYIVMELCSEGDLFGFIVGGHPTGCSEQMVFHVMSQIMTAIQSCHALGVVHSDLKPENIMLSGSDTHGPLVKLIDFGLSSVMDEEEVSTIAGTPSYMAPEAFEGRYGCEADIWSAGCIMYVLFSGELPFDLEEVEIFSRSARRQQLRAYQEFGNKFPSSKACKSMSESAKDVLYKMLTMDPCMRLTANQFFQHPWTLQNSP